MKKISFFTICATIFISCGQDNTQQQGGQNADSVVDSVAVAADPKSYLNIQTKSFSEIDTSGILMFPLSIGESDREGEVSSYKRMPEGGYWNIIFYNSRNREHHLLSDQKMLIRSFDYKHNSGAGVNVSESSDLLFYSITTADFNGDKIFDNQDPDYLFISDRTGNNLKQVSPLNYNLETWELVKPSNKIIMTVRKDSNNNKKFDNKDEVSAFEYDLNRTADPVEIFSKEFKNKLKSLYDKDWKKKKE